MAQAEKKVSQLAPLAANELQELELLFELTITITPLTKKARGNYVSVKISSRYCRNCKKKTKHECHYSPVGCGSVFAFICFLPLWIFFSASRSHETGVQASPIAIVFPFIAFSLFVLIKVFYRGPSNCSACGRKN